MTENNKMHHLLPKLFAAALTVGLFAGFGQADAMPTLSLNAPASSASPVEKARYYGYRYGYNSYRSYRPYYGHNNRSYYGYNRQYYGYGYYRPRYGYNWRY